MAVNYASILARGFGGVKTGYGALKTGWMGATTSKQRELAMSIGMSYAYHGRDPENDFPTAMGKSIVESAAYMMVGMPLYMLGRVGMPLARGIATGVPIAYKAKEAQWNQYFKPNLGGNYQDTQASLTMRQAGIQAIQGSRLNARNMLGQEASLMHR